ncbi:HAD hydrolase family protein [Enterococcus sp. AZ192]|uniref:HAD hydrolase family protein n=1 Tax=unclassified Enterococcus TaxID=2608891 RepID=UPI003D2BEECE
MKEIEKIKYCFFDIDGTMITKANNNVQPVLRRIDQLKKLGIISIIISGREYDSLEEFVKKNQTGQYFYEKSLGQFGNIIYSESGKNQFIRRINSESVEKIITFVTKKGYDYAIVCSEHIYIVNKKSRIKYQMVFQVASSRLVEVSSDLLEKKLRGEAVLSIYIFPNTPLNLECLEVAGVGMRQYRKLNTVRIFPEITKKEGASKFLFSEFKESTFQNTMFFGNDKDDVELLEAASVGVSVRESEVEAVAASNISLTGELVCFLDSFIEKLINWRKI